MLLENLNSCPICSASVFAPFLSVTDYTVSNNLFTIVHCTQCGLGITNPRPNVRSLGEYYKSETYISHTTRKNSLFDWIYTLARRFTLTRKLKQIEQHVKKGSILDYGCGTGDFLNHAKTKHWRATGVEPSEIARVKAQSFNLPVAPSLSELTGPFDVITLWHVLEHVHDLQNILAELRSKLKPGGYFFIAVPNPESFDAYHYEAKWAAYDVPRHLWHFSQKNMEQLLNKSGLEIVEKLPMKLDAYYVSMLSEKYQSPDQNGLINFVKGAWLGLRSNLKASKTGNYSSLIYIARSR